MATYVTSDIHGEFYKFMQVLDKANFDPSIDELYVLGDICDRGPHSDKMIEWAYSQPSSIHFLFGNHEDFMVAEMRRWDDFIKGQTFEDDYAKNCVKYDFFEKSIWLSWNGGIKTFEYLSNMPKSKRNSFLDWVSSWPLYYDISVNNRRYVLVHAGLAPHGLRMSDMISYEGSRAGEWVSIEGLEEEQSAMTLLWTRENWFYSDTSKLPFSIIFGHTSTEYIYDTLVWGAEDTKLYQIEGKPGKILKFNGNKIAIDCGYDIVSLLRLDDMKEFYVKE